jgi:hypothetical protein
MAKGKSKYATVYKFALHSLIQMPQSFPESEYFAENLSLKKEVNIT